MASYRILVIEDNHEVRRMVTASLKTLGAEIDVLDVPSAEEALVICASLPLDMVVLDIRLPGMSGLDMVTRLRKRRPETKIILVTGVEDTAIRNQVAQAGTEAYFFKPIEIDKFLEAVKHCLWADQSETMVSDVVPPTIEVLPVTSPAVEQPAAVESAKKAASQGLMPTLDERLTTLKQQLRAVSVLLVDDAGQVMEVAGNPSQITSGSALLSSLMHAFRASLQVSQAMGRSTGASLQYFASQRQCLYVVPVGLSYALFVITSGYFEPDKLGTIDRYFQLAVRDLQDILANIAAEEQVRQARLERQQAELAAQVTVDQETRKSVEDMFAKAAKVVEKEKVESFWEELEDHETQDATRTSEGLTYNQARDLGIAPGDNQPV
ncbi:MAG TPA: response regulator [Anaerolineales bacterium]|nr:response regulator [Anaerolineales bacterium]